MTLLTAHFYHVWADGHWKVPVHEHLRALRDARYRGEVHVGLVGSPGNRDEAQRYVTKFWSPQVTWHTADAGFEAVTLGTLQQYVLRQDAAPYVLYAHTKGAFEESVSRDLWREAMTSHLVLRGSELAVPLLADHDVVGLHWLTAEQFPVRVVTPFFGGNFWWATTAYLRTLPSVGTVSRFDAETWIGLGNPKAADLKPGWPPYDEETT